MIGKKIKRSKKAHAKSKASNIRDLVDYVLGLRNLDPDEKVLYANARGFICDTHSGWREEMVALASEAVRSRYPVDHHLLSWREGEQPTTEQIEEAIDILIDEFKLDGHQIIYSVHQDTDNVHLHIVINRVHPETHKCVEINKGFDIEAAHRVVARIEHLQGWEREVNGRYQVLENGVLARTPDSPDKKRRPGQRKRDMENRTGEKSALRVGIEEGAAIIEAAESWEQLHRELAPLGMRYEKKGSGAVVIVGDVPVKASDVDRNATLSKLQKRLGTYQPSAQMLEVAQREAEPIRPDVPGWDQYIAARNAHYAERAVKKSENDRRHAHERKALADRQKAKRAELFAGSWKGRGDLLNALRSTLAAEQAAEKAELKEKHRRERLQHREQFRPFPDLEQWQRLNGRQDLADAWRYKASEPQCIEGEQDEAPTLRDIRAFQGQIVGRHVFYTRADAEGGAAGGVSFVDHGKSIDVHEWRTRESTLAALQLAAQKWGSCTLHGDDEYKMMCVRLAAEHGFKIKNPELQEALAQERQRVKMERAEAMKSEQLKQFERYATAVGADRYRVTSIKMLAEGKKLTFILDKKDGVTRGFTPQEIAQRTREMLRLQRRGENLFYTPLSDSKHHILIDDMDRASLQRLLDDGYKPAAALESSPGNYQAIITIPKLGTSHDREVGNRLTEFLNREYGDPKLSGAIHPHRAPGYQNRKPQHQREDGSYPEVRLVASDRRECVLALALSRQMDAQYERKVELKVKQPQQQGPGAPEIGVVSDSAMEAYQLHCRDILQRQRGGALDLSRVDSMIAVRLRVTGHELGEIEDAIRLCAPGLRSQGENRDWDDYAQRTARYAFGAAGNRQAATLTKYRDQWVAMEGQRQSARQLNNDSERPYDRS